MPVFLILSFSLLIIALFLAVRASGWKKWLAWGDAALLSVPWLVAGVGGLVLSANGLAWRSCVKLPCGLMFVGGILLLLLWTAISLARRARNWRPVAGAVAACAIVTVTSLLCIAVAWYGLLFTAIWSGGDREVMVRGERMVMEYAWMDQDYYAYHGLFTRGSKRVYGSWELSREDFREAEQ